MPRRCGTFSPTPHCDVFVGTWGSGYTSNALTKITNFTAASGGMICTATPWALNDSELATANAARDTVPFGSAPLRFMELRFTLP